MQFVGLGLRGDRTCSSPGKNGGLRGTERCPMAGPPILAWGLTRQKTGPGQHGPNEGAWSARPKWVDRAGPKETACMRAGPLNPLNITFYY